MYYTTVLEIRYNVVHCTYDKGGHKVDGMLRALMYEHIKRLGGWAVRW